MTFETELETILRRYIPFSGDKDYYDNIINILVIQITNIYKKKRKQNEE